PVFELTDRRLASLHRVGHLLLLQAELVPPSDKRVKQFAPQLCVLEGVSEFGRADKGVEIVVELRVEGTSGAGHHVSCVWVYRLQPIHASPYRSRGHSAQVFVTSG